MKPYPTGTLVRWNDDERTLQRLLYDTCKSKGISITRFIKEAIRDKLALDDEGTILTRELVECQTRIRQIERKLTEIDDANDQLLKFVLQQATEQGLDNDDLPENHREARLEIIREKVRETFNKAVSISELCAMLGKDVRE